MQPKSERTYSIALSFLLPAMLMLSGCAGALTSMQVHKALTGAERMYGEGDYEGAAGQYRNAAMMESPRGQYMLGRMYAQGKGVAPNPQEAVRWTRLAAENGYPGADFEMGLRHMTGDGVPLNPGRAVFHFQRAADREHALSMYHLGFAHALGQGVAPDPGESLRWFRLARAQGFPVEDDLLSEAGIEAFARRARTEGAAQ
jgi:TPR repeat protein